jgi:cation diffusion facilitator family transporter
MRCSCDATNCEPGQRKILSLALGLNATMFAVGLVGGIVAQSVGLMADSLDMLADAVAYAIGLYAIGRAAQWKVNAARWTGWTLGFLGLAVLVEAGRRALTGATPESSLMLAIATAALVGNSLVLYLLSRHRSEGVHLRAVWICTRADVIANIAVILSAGILWLTGWWYVDLIVGAAIGAYVVKEAREILATARQPWTNADTGEARSWS